MSFEHVPLGTDAESKRLWRNRRAWVRYLCGLATSSRLLMTEKYESQLAWVLTLSRGGIGLLLGQPIETGSHVLVQLKGTSQPTTFELQARVIHATRHGTDNWIVGCEFINDLSGEDLETLL
jgi:hypothetical protein